MKLMRHQSAWHILEAITSIIMANKNSSTMSSGINVIYIFMLCKNGIKVKYVARHGARPDEIKRMGNIQNESQNDQIVRKGASAR